jgi:hypothetical protein
VIPAGTADDNEYKRYIPNCKYHKVQLSDEPVEAENSNATQQATPGGAPAADIEAIKLRCYKCQKGFVASWNEKSCMLPDPTVVAG